jgi:hypothetical protein
MQGDSGEKSVFWEVIAWSIALYGAETWTLRELDQKHLECFEM